MPLKAATICTPHRAKWTIAITLCLSTLVNVPYFFKLNVTNGGKLCVAFTDNTPFSVGYSWFLTSLNCFIPFSLLLLMNSVIIHALRHREMYIKNDATEKKKDGTNRQLTITLLSVTFAFIILCAPQYIRYVIYSVKSYTTRPTDYALYILAAQTSNKMFFTNNAVNFFLYCVGGSKFRSDLRNLFCKKVKRQTNLSKSGTAISVISEGDV